jgi:rubrerythrin
MKPHQKLSPFLDHKSVVTLKHIDPKNKINTIINTATKNKVVTNGLKKIPTDFWGEQQYNLKDSSLYKSLDKTTQNKILSEFGLHTLCTSYYIEKLAVSFCAKMVMLAESMEEKALYSIIGAEEAEHWLEFKNLLVDSPEDTDYQSPFIDALQDCIEKSDRLTSMFMAQNLLEGFGLIHYGHLRDTTTNETLKAVFTKIVEDEGRHHGSSIVLFQNCKAESFDRNDLITRADFIIRCIKSPKRHIIKTLKNHCPDMTSQDEETLIKEINLKKQVEFRTKAIYQMVKKSNAHGILDSLEEMGSFDIDL